MLSLDPTNLLLLALGLLALGIKIWALVDAVRQPTAAFPVAGKLTKPIWLTILVAAVLLSGTNVLGILGLVGTVAAIVYLVDVRPAVSAIRPGGPWG